MEETESRRLLKEALSQPLGDDLISRVSRYSILTMASRYPEYADILEEYAKAKSATQDKTPAGMPGHVDANPFASG